MKHTALIIFVRKPEWGKVKTRLARTIGNDKALLIYSKLLEHTHAISKNLTCDKYIFYAEGIPDDDIWETPPYHKKQQEGEDLGARMKNAFADVFAMGYRKVLIIGSDCYQLRDEDISEADITRLGSLISNILVLIGVVEHLLMLTLFSL